jgi:hypothetical protein
MTTKGMLLVMIDVPPEHEAELNRWYDEEHFPERMVYEGFLNGRRLIAVEGGPKYLAYYDLQSPETLQNAAYRKIAPRTPWTARIAEHFTRSVRNVYAEIRPEVCNGSRKTGTGLLLVAIDVAAEHEAELNRWWDEEHIQERMAIPGFLRARRFQAIEGAPKYLTLYDIDSPDVLQTPEYQHWTGLGTTDFTKRIRRHFNPIVRNVYRQIRARDAIGG